MAINNRGLVYEKQEKFALAKTDYLHSIRLDSLDASTWDNLAGIYDELGNKDSAYACYAYAIKLDSSNSSAYHNRGRLYYFDGKLKEAMKDYDKAIELDSMNSNAINSRGMLHSQLGNYEKAERDLQRCIRIKPDYLYPYNNLANCYFKMNRKEEACKYWKIALEKGYKYQPEWKKEYGIDDPVELVKQHCGL